MAKVMYMETCRDGMVEMRREFLETARRHQLIEWLELRGVACYDDDPTELLRECALQDWDDEYES